MKTFKSIFAPILVIISVVSLSACSNSLPTQTKANHEDAVSSIKTLEAATTINLKKKAISIGDHWSVKVDGSEVATIEGLDIPALGDTYSLLSPKGGFIAGEDEEIFKVSPTANFYDENKTVTGELRKKILSWMAYYTLKNNDGHVVATLDQKFAISFKANIKDDHDRTVWKVESKVLSWGTNITLTKVYIDTSITALDAIRMSVVASEINDSKSSN